MAAAKSNTTTLGTKERDESVLRPALIFNLALFALLFCLGIATFFVHVNTTSALVRSLGLGRFATLPLGLFLISSTLASLVLEVLMRTYGRKRAAPVASLFGVSGAMLCYAGAVHQADVALAFALLLLGSCLQGVLFLYALSLRFAAAAICPPAVRARSMSFVVGAASASGFIAREVSIGGRFWLEAEFSGSYVGMALLSVALLLPLAAADFTPHAPTAGAETGAESKALPALTPLVQLIRSPHFMIASLSTAVTYTAMAALMAATPVHMLASGFSLERSASVVQYHVLAMYAPCVLTGDLIRLLGARPVILLGYALLILGAASFTWGLSYGNFLLAMVLIGVGWNLAFLGASALIAAHFEPADLPRVQLANDAFATSMLSVGVATATVILADASWEALLWLHLSLAALGAAAIAVYTAAPRLGEIWRRSSDDSA